MIKIFVLLYVLSGIVYWLYSLITAYKYFIREYKNSPYNSYIQKHFKLYRNIFSFLISIPGKKLLEDTIVCFLWLPLLIIWVFWWLGEKIGF